MENLFCLNWFTVVPGLCKVGRAPKPKEALGVRDDQKAGIGCFKAMCNAIASLKNMTGPE